MANRDIALSVTSVMLGVMVGAGSVMYAQDIETTDGGAVAYRQAERAERFKKRHISDMMPGPDVSKTKRLKKKEQMELVAPEEAKSTCDVVKSIVAELSGIVFRVVPDNQKNTEIRMKLKNAFDKVTRDHCANEDTSAGQGAGAEEEKKMKRAAPKRVDNDCEQYEAGSVRATKCKANELLDLPYIP